MARICIANLFLIIKFTVPEFLHVSGFPNGPFALPMSKDGCPEGPSKGWKTGYINITTSLPLDDPHVYIESCQHAVKSFRHSENVTSVLGPFDKYNVQLNFCFKMEEEGFTETYYSWFNGAYGIFGTPEGCPSEFSTQNMSICLPPLLHYNVDGHVPYFNLVDTNKFTDLQFIYCKHTHVKNNGEAKGYHPFLVIQDLTRSKSDCPNIDDFIVTVDHLPVPLPVRVMNDLGEWYPYFQLEFCYYMSHEFIDDMKEDNVLTLIDHYGYPGDGYAFIRPSLITKQCGKTEIDTDTACGTIETWVMLDAGQSVLVSGILFTELEYIYLEHLKNIFVGENKWSFIREGAFLCRHARSTTSSVISHPVIVGCQKSIYGRFVTLVFESNITGNNEFSYQNIIMALNKTLVAILSYDLDLVNTIRLKSMEFGDDERVTEYINKTMEQIEFYHKRCNQELGMRDSIILNDQITASSWQQYHSPTEARPHLSGWCASSSDVKPYIQVDFEELTIVDGLEIINWNEVVTSQENNVNIQTVVDRGCYSFHVEYATNTSIFTLYNKKPFVYDESRIVGEPQYFIFTNPFHARYLRVFPSNFVNESEPCMKFEIFGCRITEYGTTTFRLDSNRNIKFNTKSTNVTELGESISFNYPFMTDFNAVYTWRIHVYSKNAFLQFAFISLRKSQPNRDIIFVNNHICEDVIILSPYDVSNDVMSALTQNISDLSRIKSISNGRVPAFSMKRNSITFLTLFACSTGHMIDGDGGFKVHVTNIDYAICDASNSAKLCTLPEMNLFTHNFLGRKSFQIDRHHYTWTLDTSTDSIELHIEIEDFDISCNSETIFEISGIFVGNKQRFCNANRPHGVVPLVAGPTDILYKPYYSNLFSSNPFSEGFQLKYQFVPRGKTIKIKYENISEDEVCVDVFKKCYIFRTESTKVWPVAAINCKRSGLSLVSLKSVSEQQFLRALLIERYRKLVQEQGIVTTANPSTATTFIGLITGPDKLTTGHSLLQHWIDGTPMAFSAWDEGEPGRNGDHYATEMSIHPLENVNPWKKVSFHREIEELHVFACEKSLKSSTRDSIKIKYEILQSGSDSYTLFQCGGGEYISKMALCNGVKECSDASDEANCTFDVSRYTTSGPIKCNDDDFQCRNGRCIHISKFCNHEVDCDDAEDEQCEVGPCKERGEFTCANGQCIRIKYACDGNVDCKDGSDELGCGSSGNIHCNIHASSCSDDTCIPHRLECDMHADCDNGEDELSCDTKYTTCDELWKDGFTKSNFYMLGESNVYVYCDFNFIFTNTTIIMTYVNTDWKQTSDTEYKITTPGVNEALNAGYTCTQKFTELPHREDMKVIELENLTYHEHVWIYELHSKDISPVGLQGTRKENASFVMTPIINDGLYGSIIMQTIDAFKVRSNRLQIGPVVCKKEEYDTSERIFCRSFVSPINVSEECIYSYDKKRNIYGCRSLNHLQNCENFTCPNHHFKCPQSYCVPYMSVCDGIFDCGDGADEEDCGCSNTEKRTVYIIYQAYHEQYDTKFVYVLSRLGGMLYTKNSSMKLVFLLTYDDMPPDTLIHDVNSKSHLPTMNSINFFYSLFDKFQDVNIDETYGIIWVADRIDTSYSSYRQPEFTLDENVHKYFVQIDKNLKTKFRVTRTQNYSSVVINDYELLGRLGSTLFPEICKAKYSDCRGMYRCSMSSVCIPLEQVCNAVRNCPYEDDEENCEEACPRGCQCNIGVTNCSGIDVPDDHDIRVSTRILDISNTEWFGRYTFERQHYCEYYKYNVILFNLSRCKITNIETKSMHCFPNLVTLDLSYNLLETIIPNAFTKLKSLRVLHLHGNNFLRTIEPGAFNGLKIDALNLTGAIIEVLYMNTFYGLNLTRLDLSNCQIQQVKDNAFNGLVSQYIDIQHNPIKEFGKSFFTGVLGVEQLVTPAYKYCCVRPAGLSEDKCLPYSDEFSSCEDLMRKTVLRVLMWVIGVMALSGNILSLFYRVMRDRKRFKLGYGIFVTNLAVADMLMGLYMMIIALADFWFTDRYIEVDEKWRNSGICKFAGILSTTSSEASVIFMCLITIDRILVVKYPFGQVRFTTKSATITCLVGWIFSLILSLLPVIYTGYFKSSFYSKSGVCLALPLTRDRPPGWLYSIVIFIGLNFATFVLIAVGQLLIYTEIKKTKTVQKSMNVSRSYDLKVARNLLLVVTTDFMCWFPIGVMGILAINGYTIPGEIYAWTAVLILPINSALNPFMFTLSAILGKANFNPNIEEQARSEHAKEIGRYLLLLHPFVAIQPGIYNEKFYALSNVQQDQKMTVKRFTFIIYRVLQFVEILHKNELVLKTLTDDDILIKLGKTRKIGSTIKVTRTPVICQDSSERTDDISLIAHIIRKWLFKLSRNDNI